jgi:DNA-binding NarL/FixJ family response regulator
MLYRSVAIDRHTAIVVEEGRIRILRTEAEAARLLRSVETVWNRSDTAELSVPPPPHPRRERILRLLAEGNTDDTIARRLGCSVRTVRSEVACTMADLNAKSRFQAGMMATRMGLI